MSTATCGAVSFASTHPFSDPPTDHVRWGGVRTSTTSKRGGCQQLPTPFVPCRIHGLYCRSTKGGSRLDLIQRALAISPGLRPHLVVAIHVQIAIRLATYFTKPITHS
ncbi:hypothetical protein IE81DRAFT_323311 [Ceraceosorus guamensis]|uniref:Uncharacterized protein n=1 Tax=Ceraceosorus guamensis TaxID=1522189 RepID=A0A316VYZ7_9BASI|nr:hypothetical protein IE81DRAFT_323311 [Ceraceosorus guamensis]PWN42554.1 hypothetical protein IE81DRAFT_323311 [Ceraceosorus guamensis]